MIGAVEGRFDVFSRLTKLHQKNLFSVALIVGDLFSDPGSSSIDDRQSLSSILNGEINVPVPTYFTLGRYLIPEQVQAKLEETDGEVCSNLYFLGKRSTIEISEGVRIVSLGGSISPTTAIGPSEDRFLPFHTENDAKALHGAHDVHILLTSHWPSSIRSNSSVRLPEDTEEPESERCISNLCSALQPRYHFSSSPHFFFEREPFFHLANGSTSDLTSVTRFISMASYGNPAKQKWLYAFSINPSAATSTVIPPGTTAPPFQVQGVKRRREDEPVEGFSRFPGGSRHQGGPKRSRHNMPPPGPESCFFCLSNPNLATHLITSIGNESYLTTAKGPLTTASTFPTLPFPAHILIIPLSHSATFRSIPSPETRSATYHEMTRYREALQNLIYSNAKGALGTVCWEISRSRNIHIHWQLLPVPVDLIKKGLVEAGFRVEAENEKYPAIRRQEVGDGSNEDGDYLRIWLGRADGLDEIGIDNHAKGSSWEKETGKEQSFILPLPPDDRFDLQFPRKVMAKLLGLEGRMHWRDCSQEEAEEKAEAEAFKKAFEPFDFT